MPDIKRMTDSAVIKLYAKREKIVDAICEGIKFINDDDIDMEFVRNNVMNVVNTRIFKKGNFIICTHPAFTNELTHELSRRLSPIKVFDEYKFIIANFKRFEVKKYTINKLEGSNVEETEGKIKEKYDVETILCKYDYGIYNINDFPVYDEDFGNKKDKKVSKNSKAKR